MLTPGDLVRTDDGYYAIVVKDHVVFLSNGCEEALDDVAWNALVPLPIHVFDKPGGATANFLELLEGRSPAQLEEREAPRA